MSQGGSWLKFKARMSDDGVSAAIKKLRKKLDNMNPVMQDIGLAYKNSVIRRIMNEVDPDGNPWPALTKKTLEFKKKHIDECMMSPTKKGVFRGKMITNIRSRTYKNEVVVGTNIKYAKRFHYGYPNPRQEPRPFLGFDEATNAAVMRAIKKRFRIR